MDPDKLGAQRLLVTRQLSALGTRRAVGGGQYLCGNLALFQSLVRLAADLLHPRLDLIAGEWAHTNGRGPLPYGLPGSVRGLFRQGFLLLLRSRRLGSQEEVRPAPTE